MLLVVAALVIGPERLPGYAEQLGQWVRRGRRFIKDAKARVDEELGEEVGDVDWAALDPRKYDPRRIVRDALLEDDEPAAPGEHARHPAAHRRRRRPRGDRRCRRRGAAAGAPAADPLRRRGHLTGPAPSPPPREHRHAGPPALTEWSDGLGAAPVAHLLGDAAHVRLPPAGQLPGRADPVGRAPGGARRHLLRRRPARADGEPRPVGAARPHPPHGGPVPGGGRRPGPLDPVRAVAGARARRARLAALAATPGSARPTG